MVNWLQKWLQFSILSWIHALYMWFWSSSIPLNLSCPGNLLQSTECREGKGLPVPSQCFNRLWVHPFALLDLASPDEQSWISLLENERPHGKPKAIPDIQSPDTLPADHKHMSEPNSDTESRNEWSQLSPAQIVSPENLEQINLKMSRACSVTAYSASPIR